MDEKTEVRALFERMQAAVRAIDYEAVRPLIADDAIMFGSFAARMTGFEEMRDRQFVHVWPRIDGFSIDFDGMTVEVRGALAWAAFFFRTGVKGSDARREGRMSFVLEKRRGAWTIVHSHDSLVPAGTLAG